MIRGERFSPFLQLYIENYILLAEKFVRFIEILPLHMPLYYGIIDYKKGRKYHG